MDALLETISGTQLGALGVLLLFILREIKDFILKVIYRRDRDEQTRKTDLVIKQIHARLNFLTLEIIKYLREKKK